MESNSVGVVIEYRGINISVSHTQFDVDRVKTEYWQRVDFNYNRVNVMFSYKSDDLSSWNIVIKICELIDKYGALWSEHMEGENNG